MPADSGVVIENKVDEFTYTWSAVYFAAWSHIYLGFMGKMSKITHFPPEPEYENYSFLNQAVADFEHGLD